MGTSRRGVLVCAAVPGMIRLQIEGHYGIPQHIEWVYSGGELFGFAMEDSVSLPSLKWNLSSVRHVAI